MLIKNTNPNELLAEFKRDKHFCPYNEEELERLKKEAERLYKDASGEICIRHNGALLTYEFAGIRDKGVSYEYKKYGSIYSISAPYSKECTECVKFEKFDKIVFSYKIYNPDYSCVWSLEVARMDDRNVEVWLWVGEEVKFKKVGRE